jgi:membrane fusion protein (multidrug efflux system)
LRRLIFPLILAAMLIAGGIYGWRWWTVGRFEETTDNAYVEADTAVIAPRIAGYVASVAVTDNQAVRVGDLLLTLDAHDYAAAAGKARADVAQARAGLVTVGATTLTEADTVVANRAEVEAARAQLAQARADLARIAPIYKQGFATKGTYDAAIAAAASRAADVARAEAAMVAQSSRRVATASQSGGARAQIAAADAAVQQAELNVSYTRVSSPIDGVVGNRSVHVGEYVKAGQRTMVIVPLQATYLIANFKETQVARMVPGQRVKLKADAFPDARLTGHVVSLSPASGSEYSILPPENATGNFTKIVQRIPVRIAIDRPLPVGVRLAPGMSVKATVDLRGHG